MDRPMNSIQDQMNAILGPQKRLYEQFAHILEPQRKLQEQLARILEPQRKLQEQFAHILEPQRKLEEQLARILEPQRKLQEQLAHILGPQRKLQEQLAHILEPQRKLQEQLAHILEPHRKIQGQLAHILEPQRQFQENIWKYLTPLNELVSSPLMEEVAISESGEVSVAGEIVDIERVNKDIENLSSDWQSYEVFLSRFFSLFENMNKSARAVLLYLLLPYIVSIFANLTTPIYQELIDSYQSTNHRSGKREIILEANSLYEVSELFGHRFVYATVLHVRQEGSANSKIIDEIYFGKTVKLIQKEKRWSFIEYVDPDTDEKKQGWVFSRYLKKFSK